MIPSRGLDGHGEMTPAPRPILMRIVTDLGVPGQLSAAGLWPESQRAESLAAVWGSRCS